MITKIEDALRQINGDVFANLCRQYLVFRYTHVYPTGFVMGKEKSKIGTPDTFIPLNDYYVFNEITTKADNTLKKLKDDISHCFEQKEVPKEKIIKIILMFNGVLDLSDYQGLKEHLFAFSKETELEVLDLKNLANQIFKSYPSLARKLGLPIDTGQILEVPEFITEYEKSKFATTLSNKFYNRENELIECLKYLENEDLLLLTGVAGTGKTKFAIELVSRFLTENKGYKPKFIRANGALDIWNDLQTYLLPDENYIIVVDDANKLKINLNLILNFKQKRKSAGIIKIILTVRNYVRQEIDNLLDKPKTMEFGAFRREELKKILQSKDFNISEYWADRIWEISKGNPRLAVMAAEAGRNGELEKLENPAHIMHEYFSSVRETIDALSDETIMKVIGLLALFRTIDFSNTAQIEEINSYFGISKEILQNNLSALYKIEIADELDDAYKIADQILGEYLVYLIFIKDKLIPFTKLLEIYFQKDGRFALGSILIQQINNFGFEVVFSLIQSDVREAWKNRIDDRVALPFIQDFYYFIPIETLTYFSLRTNQMGNADYQDYSFELYNKNHINSYADTTIEVLLNFQGLQKENFRLALEVLLEYCITSEERFQKFLKACVQGLTMNKSSFYQGYYKQIELLDFLYGKLKFDKIFYSKIILYIASTFLKDTFRSTQNYGKEITISTYAVVLTNEQKNFRKVLWDFIFSSYNNLVIRINAQKCILEYTQNFSRYEQNNEVIMFDRDLIIPFFKDGLDNDCFADNIIIENYITKLKSIKIRVDNSLLNELNNSAFQLYKTLTEDDFTRKEYYLEHERYEKHLTNKFNGLIKGYLPKGLNKLFSDYKTIFENQEFLNSELYRITESVPKLLVYVNNKDFDQFLVLYKKFARFEYANQIPPTYFPKLRMNSEKVERFRSILSNKGFIYHLPNLQVNMSKHHLRKRDFYQFLKYLEDGNIINFWFLENLLERFNSYFKDDNSIMVMVLRKLLLRAGKGNVYIPKSFFEYINNNYPTVFNVEFGTICDLYIRMDGYDRHFDYSLEVLKSILEREPDFIVRLLDSHFDKVYQLSYLSLLENDFRKLWGMENHKEVLTRILDYTNKFHRVSDNPDAVARIFLPNDEVQIKFLKYYLNDKSEESPILAVFNIVVSIFRDNRFEFLDLILKKGISLETFRKLDFVVTSMTYSGSIIPRLQSKISELAEYRDYLTNKKKIELLPYIQIIADKMDWYKREIEWSRKREFLSNWGI